MGFGIESRAEEEDLTHEEAAQTDGRKGAEGRHSIEQMLRVW